VLDTFGLSFKQYFNHSEQRSALVENAKAEWIFESVVSVKA